MKKPTDIDDYISRFPKETQIILEQMRTTIMKAAPKSEEVISYSMPAFKLNGMLVYFAGYKKHRGFYPMPLPSMHLKKNCQFINHQKGLSSFH